MAKHAVTFQFYGTSFERYARKFIAKNHWRVRHVQPDFEDALQEAALEFLTLLKIVGSEVDSPRWLMALYKKHLAYAFLDLARKHQRHQAALEAAREVQLLEPPAEGYLHYKLAGASRELSEVLRVIAVAPRELLDLLLPMPNYRFSAANEARISRSWSRLAKVTQVREDLVAELRGLLA